MLQRFKLEMDSETWDKLLTTIWAHFDELPEDNETRQLVYDFIQKIQIKRGVYTKPGKYDDQRVDIEARPDGKFNVVIRLGRFGRSRIARTLAPPLDTMDEALDTAMIVSHEEGLNIHPHAKKMMGISTVGRPKKGTLTF